MSGVGKFRRDTGPRIWPSLLQDLSYESGKGPGMIQCEVQMGALIVSFSETVDSGVDDI